MYMTAETYTEKREWSPAETENFYKQLLEQALATIPASGPQWFLGPMFRIRSPKDNFCSIRKKRKHL